MYDVLVVIQRSYWEVRDLYDTTYDPCMTTKKWRLVMPQQPVELDIILEQTNMRSNYQKNYGKTCG